MTNKKFSNLFQISKPIIGRVLLAGDSREDKLQIALKELIIYEEEGVNGALIEDYHGTFEDVFDVLEEASKRGLNIVIGVKISRNPYSGFNYTHKFGGKFVQFDSVQSQDFDLNFYEEQRVRYPEIMVLGGVGFKYSRPTGNPLELDLEEAKPKCEAIVTTGDGAGTETPLSKLIEYKNLLGDFPLLVGAGVNIDNASEQLKIADGAIVGRYLKSWDGNTLLPVNRERVRDFMEVVKEVRGNREE